ncbi:MAG TPA: hypothetical protein VFT84_09015, partial [Gemmatimonadales bacterium]|nr:hypothetical protein [Gemmatimonadales bacterium]
TAGLLLAGLGGVTVAAVLAARSGIGRALPAVIACAAGLALALPALGGLAAGAGLARVCAVGAAVAVAGVAGLSAAGRIRVGDAIRHRQPHFPEPSRPTALAVVVGSVVVAGFGGHVALILLAGIAGAWAAWLAPASPERGAPVAAVVGTLLLLPSLWLLATISGPEGLALSAIPWLPLSPAAERLLGLLLFAAVVVLGGPWPLRQPLDGVLTAPLGALLLIRLALPAAPEGLAHWRAAAFPLVVVGLWHASLTRRTPALAVGGALLGLASLDAAGIRGAGWLLACGIGLALSAGRGERGALFRSVLAAAGWLGALDVLAGGLRTEAVYSVVAALAGLLALAGRGPETSATPSAAALTPPPVGSIFGRETR